jgi:amino acid transporter
MGAIVLALTFACAIGILTTASRMTWSFARDKGTPFSSVIQYVSKGRKIPTIAIGVVAFIAALLTLIYIGSPVAFNDVISLTVTGFYSSYLIPSAFLLYHRIKGNVLPHKQDTPGIPLGASDLEEENRIGLRTSDDHGISSSNDPAEKIVDGDSKPPLYSGADPAPEHPSTRDGDEHVAIAQAPLVWGPFHLPGWFGIINNAYACTYMVYVIFWSVWPPATPVDYQTMNYSVVVTGGVIIFSLVWYYFRGRKEYKGPRVDGEVEQVMRRGSVVTI